MNHQTKFETRPDYPEPNWEMNATDWLFRHPWVMGVPAVMFIVACYFKEEIDSFTNTLYFHAFLSLFLGFLTVIVVIWAIKRTYQRFIKR